MKDQTLEIGLDRYYLSKIGFMTYAVLCGDGTRHLFTGSKKKCLIVASELRGAFYDGAFVEARI